MINYNWSAIKRICNNDCKKIIYVMRLISGLKKITTRDYVKYSTVIRHTLVAPNWLDKQKEFLKSRSTDSEKCVYLELASLRNKFKVNETGYNRIPVHYLDEQFSLEKLKWNKLITIENNFIYFKY